MESSPPSGMWSAAGEAAARAPSLTEIRRGSFGSNGWDEQGQRRNSLISERRLSRSGSGHDAIPTRKSLKSPEVRPAVVSRSDEIQEEDDGFPDMVFGRGEMTDQSYVRGPPKSNARAAASSTDVDVDSDLDSLNTHSNKRASKNLKAMFGESPNASLRPSISTTPPPIEKLVPNEDGVYPNGYAFPAKHSWGEATLIGLKAFGKFSITPLGFFIVLYGANVIAWGGMLFLLLCNASPAMCYSPYFYEGEDCNNINSPRRIWIEYDSQIVNALFCVTGFGLIPWRFRDLYYLIKFRVMHQQDALRHLAGIHKSWFRLPGSENLPVPRRDVLSGADLSLDAESNSALPLPLTKTPSPPLTGVRAPATPLWKMDYVILFFVVNTMLQGVLSGFMWGFNRYQRPSWSTGLFVALACIVAAMAGIMQFNEGKRIKKVEGVPVEVAEEVRDLEAATEKRKTKA